MIDPANGRRPPDRGVGHRRRHRTTGQEAQPYEQPIRSWPGPEPQSNAERLSLRVGKVVHPIQESGAERLGVRRTAAPVLRGFPVVRVTVEPGAIWLR